MASKPLIPWLAAPCKFGMGVKAALTFFVKGEKNLYVGSQAV